MLTRTDRYPSIVAAICSWVRIKISHTIGVSLKPVYLPDGAIGVTSHAIHLEYSLVVRTEPLALRLKRFTSNTRSSSGLHQTTSCNSGQLANN